VTGLFFTLEMMWEKLIKITAKTVGHSRPNRQQPTAAFAPLNFGGKAAFFMHCPKVANRHPGLWKAPVFMVAIGGPLDNMLVVSFKPVRTDDAGAPGCK
jgi:hypothetical protein